MIASTGKIDVFLCVNQFRLVNISRDSARPAAKSSGIGVAMMA